MVPEVGWLALWVGVLYHYDWLHWDKQDLFHLCSEHSRKGSDVRRGHERPFVSFPPLCCKPHSVWAVLSACPCGCQKHDSLLPPAVSAAKWVHSLLVGSPGREKTRTPPQGLSGVLGNCAANQADLNLTCLEVLPHNQVGETAVSAKLHFGLDILSLNSSHHLLHFLQTDLYKKA